MTDIIQEDFTPSEMRAGLDHLEGRIALIEDRLHELHGRSENKMTLFMARLQSLEADVAMAHAKIGRLEGELQRIGALSNPRRRV